MLHDIEYSDEVQITVEDGLVLSGEIFIPQNAKAVIIFAHGKGSNSRSPRNRYMAEILHQESFATVLIDLLTEEESDKDDSQFDVDLLADRLVTVRRWVDDNPHTEALVVGLVGSSTGAAAALKTVSLVGNNIGAVVSRGGRPYLAMDALSKIDVPVMLIVGGKDKKEKEMNQEAYEKLKSEKELVVIDGASHLFEEDGKLEDAAIHTREWFLKHI